MSFESESWIEFSGSQETTLEELIELTGIDEGALRERLESMANKGLA